MKRAAVIVLTVLVVAIMVSMAAPPAVAHDYERGDSDNPLRIVAYSLHPFGIAMEYGIMRPIHHLVSQPNLRIIFGHDPRNEINEKGVYPVCPLCKGTPALVPCPNCSRPLMRPRDEYWTWR